MNNANNPAPDLEAFGALVARIPEVAQLIEYRKSLPPDTSEEAASQLVIARMQEMVLGRMDLAGGFLDQSLWVLLRESLLPELDKLWGPLTVRQALSGLSTLLGVDALIAGYIELAARGVPTYPDVIKGGVVSLPAFRLGQVESSPMVLLAASPMSSLDELIVELRDTCHRDFSGVRVHKVQTYQELARMAELMDRGLNRREITWQLLADRFPEIAAASDEERQRHYKPEYTRKRAALRQMFKRLDTTA